MSSDVPAFKAVAQQPGGGGGKGQSAPPRFSPGNFCWPTGKKRGKEITYKTTEICFGSTKMGIFYQEKAFHKRKKNWKNDFAPSEKYSSYAPDSKSTFFASDFKFRIGVHEY